jgi:hypothetical protein
MEMGWGTYVSDKVERLENDLRHVPAADRANVDYVLVWASLRDARILAELANISPDLEPPAAVIPLIPTPATKPPDWNWWSGDRTERAYAALFRGEAAYLALAPDAILRQRSADLLSELPLCGLPTTDTRYNSYKQTLTGVASTSPTPPVARQGPNVAPAPVVPPAAAVGPAVAPPVDPPVPVDPAIRQTLKEIAETIGQYNAGQHYRARTYRNMLLATAAGLFVLYLVLSLVGWRDPNFLSLCASNAALKPPCPSGAAPGGGDIFLLGFAGFVGGAVGALVLLLSVSVSGGPFTLAIAQALLKLPAGATISLVGLRTAARNARDTHAPVRERARGLGHPFRRRPAGSHADH